MKIQGKVNFQEIQQAVTETQNQEKSTSTNTTRDIFESKMEVQKESALFKKAKDEAGYYTGNVEAAANNSPNADQTDDQKTEYSQAAEKFKTAIQIVLEHAEREKTALNKLKA